MDAGPVAIVISEPFISNFESLSADPFVASPASIFPCHPGAKIPPPGTLRAGSPIPPMRCPPPAGGCAGGCWADATIESAPARASAVMVVERIDTVLLKSGTPLYRRMNRRWRDAAQRAEPQPADGDHDGRASHGHDHRARERTLYAARHCADRAHHAEGERDQRDVEPQQ